MDIWHTGRKEFFFLSSMISHDELNGADIDMAPLIGNLSSELTSS